MSRKIFILSLVTLFLFIAAAQIASAQAGRIGAPDGVRQAIEAKARELNLGNAWGGEISEYTAVPGGLRGWSQYYDRGVVYYVTGYGALWMTNAMQQAYRGDPYTRMTHALGFPVSNEFRCLTPDARDRYQFFERGTIFWRAAESQYEIREGAGRPATPGDCGRRAGPTATVVTQPQAPLGRKPPARHRYRVTILGFTANRQTFDGYQEMDGKGDEVYLAAQVTRFQASGQMLSNTGERGVLMGDTNQRPADEERQTVGNLSADGGIGDGYTYLPGPSRQGRYLKSTLPWVVFEGDLTAGVDALTVIPSIWEWDGRPARFNWYQEWIFGHRPGGRPVFFYDPEPRQSDAPRGATTVGAGWINQLVSESVRSTNGLAPISTWGAGPIITNPRNPVYVEHEGDQPIGLNLPTDGSPGRYFVPQILFLTDQLAQTVVNRNFPLPAVRTSDGNIGTIVEPRGSRGPGVIPIHYSGTDEGSGDYTVFVKVEQIP